MSVNPFDVVVAMARRAHDLGLVWYQETGAAPANLSVPLVVFGDLPAKPIRAVAVNIYDVPPELDAWNWRGDNPLVKVQWRFREPGDDGGRAAHARAHTFFEAMNSEMPGPWPGSVAPAWCYRVVSGEAVIDGDCWSKPDSYEIRYNPGD